ncbi:hypothetical protein [Treponema phagedenis]|uniref:hypothetical protein n=1 Tax=Treponema phagedenis TaxID=162 RepID=UPI0017B857DF|nr:hypothetical protein [Treponema phagedenis]NVP23122.1 hypothetical protein [Treponema phagedenis]
MEKICAFKTSFLRGTTAIRGGSDFAVRGKTNPVCVEPRASVPVLIFPSMAKPNLRVLKALGKSLCF